MIRISFRQGMLAGFAIIVLLLGGAALQSWLLLERLLEQSRLGSEQAVELTASIQELAERSIDIERSARQFLVVDNPAFRQRFDEHLTRAGNVLNRLEGLAAEPLAPTLGGWRMVAQALRGALDRNSGKKEVLPLLARLGELNGLLKQNAQHWLEERNARLLLELEASRLRLGGQLALALAGALLAATAMGWWLLRPVHQLEQAIGRLGASRFEAPVVVGGPDDLRRVGKRLDWLRQRLAELESDRERALRHVSHELKTPLTALKEGVALLGEEVPGRLNDPQREVVDILRHNVAGLQKQIESLLTLNAAAFEAHRLQRQKVSVSTLLQQVADRRELHSQARNLRVGVEAPPDEAMLDIEKVAVVLDNLLSNAIDFSPEGGEIHLSATRSDDGWRFDCVDEGAGIDAADAERIFDPFFQGGRPAPVERQGSGVGLSIVRELLRAMNGSVRLLPSERGAHFRVDIPDDDETTA